MDNQHTMDHGACIAPHCNPELNPSWASFEKPDYLRVLEEGNVRFDVPERVTKEDTKYPEVFQVLGPTGEPLRRVRYEDSLARVWSKAMGKENNVYPIGDFNGLSMTRTDFYRPPPVETAPTRGKIVRKLELPPFVGVTTHQSDFKPPFFGDKPKASLAPMFRPAARYGAEFGGGGGGDGATGYGQPVRSTDYLRNLVKDIRKIDYTTTNQDEFQPPPEWGRVKERYALTKLPWLFCLPEYDKTYKQMSMYKSHYVYFNVDPMTREYDLAQSEMVDINPHPVPRF